MNGLVATVELDEDEAAERFMTGGVLRQRRQCQWGHRAPGGAPKNPIPKSCTIHKARSPRVPEHDKPKEISTRNPHTPAEV